MPRGDPTKIVSNAARTPQKVKENAIKAGKASGEARRKKKERREIFRDVLDGKYTDSEGEIITGEELLIRGIATNLANPSSKNWLGTAKMVVEAMGYGSSPDATEKLQAEIEKIKAETELTKAKIEDMKRYAGDAVSLPDDPLSASLREEAEKMNNAQ